MFSVFNIQNCLLQFYEAKNRQQTTSIEQKPYASTKLEIKILIVYITSQVCIFRNFEVFYFQCLIIRGEDSVLMV